MKYILIFVVLCATSAFGQNAYGTDYLNLHCTAPDPSAPPNFGDFPKPGLVPTSAATGNAILYCDASSSSIKVSFSGGAYGGLGSLPTGLTFTAPTLTVSAAGSGNGTLALSGNTSGTATLTAPAVAGTSTNGITVSNVLLGPNGSASNPTYAWSGDTQSGLYSNGAGGPSIAASGTALIIFSTAHIDINATTTPFGWGAFNSMDTGISRTAAAVLSFGNGAQADETALIRDANACRVTADIPLPVNTATTVCTWSLPAVAKAWAWQCDIPWAITAGTGTNTISIGVNASQTPTGTTNTTGVIYSAAATFVTAPAVALSASGAVNVITSGTITPGANAWTSHTSGTLLASATAGTFAVTMTAAGTTATAAAKAGATCTLY